MKKGLIVLVVIVLAILLYTQKHAIKSMLTGGTTPAATTTSTPAASSSSTSTSAILTTQTSTSKGQYLGDSKGLTVYIFDKDTSGISNCTAGCLKIWPPYTAPAATATDLPANVTIITRSDGTFQYAYKGMPLYYYAQDQQVGDITGDGVGGIWHLVKP